MLQAGLRKAFDFNTTAGSMESGGWRLPTFAAFMMTAAETAGGHRPAAGFADAAGRMCNHRRDDRRVGGQRLRRSVLVGTRSTSPFLIAVGAAALLFTGAGGYSLTPRSSGAHAWPPLIGVGIARPGDRRRDC